MPKGIYPRKSKDQNTQNTSLPSGNPITKEDELSQNIQKAQERVKRKYVKKKDKIILGATYGNIPELEQKILESRTSTPWKIPKEYFIVPVKHILLFVDARGEKVKNGWHNIGCYRKAKSYPVKGMPRKHCFWNITVCALFDLKPFEGQIITVSGNMIHICTRHGNNSWLLYCNDPKDIIAQTPESIKRPLQDDKSLLDIASEAPDDLLNDSLTNDLSDLQDSSLLDSNPSQNFQWDD